MHPSVVKSLVLGEFRQIVPAQLAILQYNSLPTGLLNRCLVVETAVSLAKIILTEVAQQIE
ncbi:MAG: hypothetical protein GY943_36540 [Chloroflexi bacterium]|nr:hypothetical protein [Chloroflexota bacterium]